MIRGMVVLIICLCMTFSMINVLDAGSVTNRPLMQKHIEKVKRTKPEKYEAMVQRAGGNITGCRSCHEEVGKERNPCDALPSDLPSK
jgi:hypothetical protein